MTDARSFVGIDRCGERFCIAEVCGRDGHAEITWLTRAGLDETFGPSPSQSVVVSVSDETVLMKPIKVDRQAADRQQRAEFELSQSLTADESAYVFNTVETGLNDLLLGCVARRSELECNIPAAYGSLLENYPVKSALARSIALARGFIQFGVKDTDGLICLAEASGPVISIALIINDKPVAFGRLALNRFDITTEPGRERLAVELKTIISFRLAALFEHGLTRPLSALLLSGQGFDGPMMETLRNYFSMPVQPTRINPAHLADSVRHETERASDYIVPLGLVANLLA